MEFLIYSLLFTPTLSGGQLGRKKGLGILNIIRMAHVRQFDWLWSQIKEIWTYANGNCVLEKSITYVIIHIYLLIAFLQELASR